MQISSQACKPAIVLQACKVSLQVFRSIALYRFVIGWWLIIHVHKRMGRVSFISRGGLKSLARIFFPLLAQKSSKFFPEYYLIFAFARNGYLKTSRGAAAPLSPMGRTPMSMLVCLQNVWTLTVGHSPSIDKLQSTLPKLNPLRLKK